MCTHDFTHSRKYSSKHTNSFYSACRSFRLSESFFFLKESFPNQKHNLNKYRKKVGNQDVRWQQTTHLLFSMMKNISRFLILISCKILASIHSTKTILQTIWNIKSNKNIQKKIFQITFPSKHIVWVLHTSAVHAHSQPHYWEKQYQAAVVL